MNNCELCGTVKVWKEGGISKAGKPFDAFWSCPKWKQHPPKALQAPTANENKMGGEILIMEGINALNKRLDDMAKFLVALDTFLKSKLG